MRPAHEIQADLTNFTGTEAYHRWSILFRNFVLTDGAKYVKDGAYSHIHMSDVQKLREALDAKFKESK